MYVCMYVCMYVRQLFLKPSLANLRMLLLICWLDGSNSGLMALILSLTNCSLNDNYNLFSKTCLL